MVGAADARLAPRQLLVEAFDNGTVAGNSVAEEDVIRVLLPLVSPLPTNSAENEERPRDEQQPSKPEG